MHHDLAELRQCWLELLPDPDCQAFAGGIFQPVDIVEIVVIQAVVDRLKGGLDIAEIHDPAGLGAGFAADMQLHSKRMPVQARAFVPRRHIGKPVRGFKRKDFEDIHVRHCKCAGPSEADGKRNAAVLFGIPKPRWQLECHTGMQRSAHAWRADSRVRHQGAALPRALALPSRTRIKHVC